METPTPLTTLRVDLVMEIKKFSFSLVNRAPGFDLFLECHYPTSNAASDYRRDQASWIDRPHSASGFYCYKQASVRTNVHSGMARRHTWARTGAKGGLTLFQGSFRLKRTFSNHYVYCNHRWARVLRSGGGKRGVCQGGE